MKAFTIIEMLIGVFILLLLMAGIISVLHVVDLDWQFENGLLDLHQSSRQAMHGIVRELRQARHSNVVISDSGTTVDFIIPSDIFTSSTTYYDAINYTLTSNQIVREHPAGTTNILGNDVTALSFCFWDGSDCCDIDTEDCSGLHSLQISLTVEKSVRQKTLSFSLTEKVRLRNE